MPHAVLECIDRSEDELLALQRNLVALPALGPTNGGSGEEAKAAWLYTYLEQFPGAAREQIQAPDERVPCGFRPSIVVRREGESARTLWLVAHTDVVPPGDRALWETDPFTLHRDGDLIYGRGVEDNHQGLVSSLLLLRALETTGARTRLSLGILLAADEETGSELGVEYILNHRPELFRPDDLILIPDFGAADGGSIEIAEKSVFWFRFTVCGRQCHASTPEQGINTLTAASALILDLERLGGVFPLENPLFRPPCSTFAPTRKEANVPNVNTIPGQDVFYLDCRVLPEYTQEQIETEIRALCDAVEAKRGVSISFTAVTREQAAPFTPGNSPVVTRLTDTLRLERGIEPRVMGIGGGTVAACFRRRGLPAVCWSTLMHTAHQPNEHSSIRATLADARVFARLLFDSPEDR